MYISSGQSCTAPIAKSNVACLQNQMTAWWPVFYTESRKAKDKKNVGKYSIVMCMCIRHITNQILYKVFERLKIFHFITI